MVAYIEFQLLESLHHGDVYFLGPYRNPSSGYRWVEGEGGREEGREGGREGGREEWKMMWLAYMSTQLKYSIHTSNFWWRFPSFPPYSTVKTANDTVVKQRELAKGDLWL